MDLAIIVEIFTFLIVAAVTIGLMSGVRGQMKVRERLKGQRSAGAAAAGPAGGGGGLIKSERLTNPFLLWVQNATLQKDTKERDKVSRDLALAGFHHPAAPAIFVFTRFSLAVGLPTLFMFSQTFAAKPMTGMAPSVMALAFCGLGLMAPGFFVRGRADSRRTTIEHQFPDALDLLVVCVEAGLSLEAAFQRVSREIEESHPLVADLFAGLSNQLTAGRGRADALRAMGERADVAAVRSFVGLLVQTESLGVGVGQTLRTYATEMRANRFVKAEEKAMRVPLLITLPLVTCLLPVIVGVLLLPAIIDIVRKFGAVN